MKVLMVAAVNFPTDPRIEREANALIDDGHEVSLICFSSSYKQKKYGRINLIQLPMMESSLKAPFNWIIDYLVFCTLATLYTYLYSIDKNVIHVHNPPDFIVPLLFPLRVIGKKIVFDIHDPTHILAKSRLKGKNKIIIQFLELFFDTSCLLASDNITVSDIAADTLITSDYVVIVPNAAPNVFYEIREKIRHNNVIIYSGAMVEGRKLDVLVKAMNHVDGKLIMLGNGQYLQHLKSISPPNVLFFNGVHYSDVPKVLTKASIGVIPLEDTPINRIGSPNKLYEFIAAGMPVICSRFEGIESIAKDNVVYFKDNIDYLELALVLQTMLVDKQLWNNYREKAMQLSDKLRWEDAKLSLLKLYRRYEK